MENEIQDIKLSSEPGKDKFLFFVEPKNIDNECIGGISLANGIKIFAVVTLIQAISSLMEIFQAEVFLEKLGYIILTTLFFLVCFSLCMAAFMENMTFAKISYWLAAILFIISAVKFLCKSVLKTIEFINPLDGDFLDLKFLTYILGRGLYLFIYLYFIWIVFCFLANHEKNN